MNAPDVNAGLTIDEAALRLARDGPNRMPTAERRSLRTIAWQAAREPMFALLLAAGSLYLVLGELHEGMLMFALVLATLGMTLYEENRAERALDALRGLSTPRALVIREGRRLRIDSPGVVVGDLCVLGEGDRVPADGVLVAGRDLRLDESLLTGESEPRAPCRIARCRHAGQPGGRVRAYGPGVASPRGRAPRGACSTPQWLDA